MLKEMSWNILCDYARGRHSRSQIVNACKYFLGKKQSVVSWKPIYLTAFTTYRCNLSCDMCLTHSRKHGNVHGQKPCKDMTYETFKQILNKYREALIITLTGNGEPLLNKDFFRMAEYASKVMNMYVFSATNGTLTGQYQEQLVNSYLDQLSISVNAHNPKEYKRLTGMSEEYFDLICKNTKELVKRRNNTKNTKLKLWISYILDKTNYVYLSEMVDFARELHVDGLQFLHFLPNQKDGFRAEERCLFSDDKSVIEQFSRTRNTRTNIKIVFPRLLKKSMFNGSERFKYCRVPFYNLTIDSEGNVGGCGCQLLDNSKNGKFHEPNAWNNDYFQQFRNRFIKADLDLLEPCTWCHNNLPTKASSFLTLVKNLFQKKRTLLTANDNTL